MKLAVIFESSPFDRKGLFNAVHNRVRHLMEVSDMQIDVFCIHSRDNFFTRRVRHTPETPDVDSILIDGIRYNLLWYSFSIMDHITIEKLHRRPRLFDRFISDCLPVLESYDLVAAHSLAGALVAYELRKKHGIPYYITWHGSDVHTHPWRNPVVLEATRTLMEDASCNFFVSEALRKESERITVKAVKDVLYNGVSDRFAVLPSSNRTAARLRYGLSPEEKVVAFAGSLVAVKNVRLLSDIFSRIKAGYDGPLKFWIAGDGKLRAQVLADMSRAGLKVDSPWKVNVDGQSDVHMWGNVPSDDMPELLNCVDVLVLPSLNEGLPLVCAEAVRCGVCAVASDVGGVGEILARKFLVPLGESKEAFAAAFAEKVISLLNESYIPILPEYLSWKATALKELVFIRKSF